ncbi:MAG: DUF1571 domain-containing protein [Rubripirellula sp.]
MVKTRRGAWLTIVVLITTSVAWLGLYVSRRNVEPAKAESKPTKLTESESGPGSGVDSITMSEVLDLAVATRQNMASTLKDYQGRFIKQEVDTNGVLGGVSEILVKVQTGLRDETNKAPKRVYLKFTAPENVKGREVIWGEDLYDGKMAVHEVGLLIGLKTLWLDPEGILAMQGQRYPISEIGLVKLTEKLIERGEKDRDNPDITVSMIPDQSIEDVEAQLIQVRRSKPSGMEDDFSLAEIIFDPDRQLILGYRSFGWSEKAEDDPPLLESYLYRDVETNVGLTDKDFDTTNPEYNFPAF